MKKYLPCFILILTITVKTPLCFGQNTINLGESLNYYPTNPNIISIQIKNLLELPDSNFQFRYFWLLNKDLTYINLKSGTDTNFANIEPLVFDLVNLTDSCHIKLLVESTYGDFFWSGIKVINFVEPQIISHQDFCNNQPISLTFSDSIIIGNKYSIVYQDSIIDSLHVPILGTTLFQNDPIFYPEIAELEQYRNTTRIDFDLLVHNSNNVLMYKKHSYFTYSKLNAPLLPPIFYNCSNTLNLFSNNFEDNIKFNWYKRNIDYDELIYSDTTPVFPDFLDKGKYVAKVSIINNSNEEVCADVSSTVTVLDAIDDIYLLSNKESIIDENDTAILSCVFDVDSMALPLISINWFKDNEFFKTTDGIFLETNMPGDYHAQYTNSCGIESSTNTINLLAGIIGAGVNEKQNGDFKEIYLYPNPAKDKINIHFPDLYIGKPINIRVYNISNSQLRNLEIIAESVIILNITDFRTGTYYIKIEEKKSNISTLNLTVIK